MPERKQPTALFVADSHFHLRPDSDELNRIGAFLEFLRMAHQVEHLFLLGDIFDFWFDYPHFRLKGYEDILRGLDQVRQAGVQIHFVGGNHDIWAADYFHRRFGCARIPKSRILTLGELRIRVSHGDGLLGFNWAYNSFRSLVRNRAGIVLAKSLHPEILFAFSIWLSGKSRSARREEHSEIERKARIWLTDKAKGQWDLMVMGHLHHGFDVSVGAYRLAAVPGWLDPLGYGLLRDGEFQLRVFPDDPFAEPGTTSK
ncbi:MAG: UDP-2,3-diacylglucosamine diphosphatase [Gemmatimonadales bacterium]|nr:UDP-2,3-diacylglucosamine diphosphatase [Gemmatimonadales bacterium]